MPVKRPGNDELAYTKSKIEANFSNFSAWHQRSKVFASLWEQGLSVEKDDRDSGEFAFMGTAD
jgi:geranylgeranyl transferase type-2 subunit alpha